MTAAPDTVERAPRGGAARMKALDDGEPTRYWQPEPDTVDPAKNRRQPTGLAAEPTGKGNEGPPSGPRNKLGLLGH